LTVSRRRKKQDGPEKRKEEQIEARHGRKGEGAPVYGGHPARDATVVERAHGILRSGWPHVSATGGASGGVNARLEALQEPAGVKVGRDSCTC